MMRKSLLNICNFALSLTFMFSCQTLYADSIEFDKKHYKDICKTYYKQIIGKKYGGYYLSGTEIRAMCSFHKDKVDNVSLAILDKDITHYNSIKYCIHNGIGRLEYSKFGASCSHNLH